MRFIKTMVFIAVMFFAAGCAQSVAVEVGGQAPDFTLTDINGKEVSLSGFSGKAVIIDFFASWCPPCRQEVPDFIELQKAYGDKGFAMIGIAVEDGQAAKNFAEKSGINYPVLVDDEKVSALYGPIRSIPTTFVIDKSGKIVKMYIGARPKAVFEADIKEILK